MTRENKLALVIGFGLLLLAGIFVSDHLSAQQRTDEEPLVASEELVVPSPDILAARSAPAALNPTPAIQEQRRSAPRATSSSTPTVQEIVIGQRRTTPVPSNLQVHYVAKGETLTAITRKYYGNTDQVGYLAKHNNLTNPNRVAVGTRLVIPKVPSSTALAQAPQPRVRAASTPSPTPVTKKTITVRKGDTLGAISMRAFGTTKRWPDIAEINQDVLPDPDRLRPGMTLRLPSS